MISKLTALNFEVNDLRKDVDYLKSIDFTSLLEVADNVDAPTTSKISPTTTGDVQMDDIVVDESEAEADEDQIEVPEETIYGDLPKIEKTIVESLIQTSLIDTSMVGPSELSDTDVTPGTDASTDGRTV